MDRNFHSLYVILSSTSPSKSRVNRIEKGIKVNDDFQGTHDKEGSPICKALWMCLNLSQKPPEQILLNGFIISDPKYVEQDYKGHQSFIIIMCPSSVSVRSRDALQ